MDIDFNNVTIDMKPWVESFTKPWHLNNSEYVFTNLLMWGTDGRIQLAEADDALFFLLQYGGDDPFMFAPLTRNPQGDYARALDAAVRYCSAHGILPVFKAIAGPIKAEFERCAGYSLTEDRDNYDYIYNMEDLRGLAGKKLHSKRNHINQFRAQYAFEYVEVTSAMMDECLDVYANWLENKDVLEPGVLGELEAIRQILTHMEYLGVRGGGIRVDGELVAFSLGERIDQDMAVIHIEKADEMTGLYSIINQQFIEHEFTDMKLINREEDMGLEGLRKAKMSYNPITLLEKFVGRPL